MRPGRNLLTKIEARYRVAIDDHRYTSGTLILHQDFAIGCNEQGVVDLKVGGYGVDDHEG